MAEMLPVLRRWSDQRNTPRRVCGRHWRCPPHKHSTKRPRGYKMAVIAVAHRLARILFAMLRDGTDFDVHRLGIAVGPFTRTTVDAYRLKRAPRAHRA